MELIEYIFNEFRDFPAPISPLSSVDDDSRNVTCFLPCLSPLPRPLSPLTCTDDDDDGEDSGKDDDEYGDNFFPDFSDDDEPEKEKEKVVIVEGVDNVCGSTQTPACVQQPSMPIISLIVDNLENLDPISKSSPLVDNSCISANHHHGASSRSILPNGCGSKSMGPSNDPISKWLESDCVRMPKRTPKCRKDTRKAKNLFEDRRFVLVTKIQSKHRQETS